MRTHTAKWIADAIVRQPLVTHLRMNKPVYRLAIDDGAATNPAADGDVHERARTLSSAPAKLGERRAVDVRVEGHRDVQGPVQWPDDVDVAPSRLGRGSDRAERRRSRIEIDRPEAGDPERHDRGSRGLLREERHHVANRLVGRGRGNSRVSAYIVGPRAHRTHELRSAGFNAPDQPCYVLLVV